MWHPETSIASLLEHSLIPMVRLGYDFLDTCTMCTISLNFHLYWDTLYLEWKHPRLLRHCKGQTIFTSIPGQNENYKCSPNFFLNTLTVEDLQRVPLTWLIPLFQIFKIFLIPLTLNRCWAGGGRLFKCCDF